MAASTFKDWFDLKLHVGMFPIMQDENFQAADYRYIINVSDEFYINIELQLQACNCKTYWFPMNEMKKDAGLNSIYGAMTILRLAESQNASVYLHCHAGINRSQAVRSAYYYMRTGKHFGKTISMHENRLLAMCSRCFLPSKGEMEVFLNSLGQELQSGKSMAGVLDLLKLTMTKQ